MSTTIAVHVHYKSLYISLLSSTKQQRGMTNSALSEERELRRLIKNAISNLLRCPRFSFAKALTVINKLNDLRVSRNS